MNFVFSQVHRADIPRVDALGLIGIGEASVTTIVSLDICCCCFKTTGHETSLKRRRIPSPNTSILDARYNTLLEELGHFRMDPPTGLVHERVRGRIMHKQLVAEVVDWTFRIRWILSGLDGGMKSFRRDTGASTNCNLRGFVGLSPSNL